MPDVVWGSMASQMGEVVCTAVSALPGPPANDNWQVVAEAPDNAGIVAGSRCAVLVSGTILPRPRVGTLPRFGLVQVCLGDSTGFLNPWHHVSYQARQLLRNGAGGVPFQFLVVLDLAGSGVGDPWWGGTWPSGRVMQLWARTWLNGDTAYPCEFAVADVTWLAFDLSTIPAGRHFVEQQAPPAPVSVNSTAFVDQHISSAVPGAAGQRWLYLVNAAIGPTSTVDLLSLQSGTTATGSLSAMSVRLGTRPWALRGGTINGTPERHHLGGLSTFLRPAGTLQWGYRASGLGLLHAWRVFGLRVDELPEVQARAVTESLSGAGNLPAVILHEPPPLNGMIARPVYLASCCATTGDPLLQHFRLRVGTNRNVALWPGRPSQAAAGDGLPLFAAAQFGLGRGDGARYEIALLRDNGAGMSSIFAANDVEALQFWLVQDPSIQAPNPSNPGPPVVIVPAREGAGVASQSDLPIQPATPIPMQVEMAEAAIQGAAGVRRTWPLFTGPRRVWELPWPVLSEAQRLTLEAFLDANVTFRWRPPQETSAIAVKQIGPPTWQMLDPRGPTWACSVPVAELIWVGAG